MSYEQRPDEIVAPEVEGQIDTKKTTSLVYGSIEMNDALERFRLARVLDEAGQLVTGMFVQMRIEDPTIYKSNEA